MNEEPELTGFELPEGVAFAAPLDRENLRNYLIGTMRRRPHRHRPLLLVEGPAGAGKTALVKALILHLWGDESPCIFGWPGSDAEMTQLINTAIISERKYLWFDDVSGLEPLVSPPAARAVTEQDWAFRLLGTNEIHQGKPPSLIVSGGPFAALDPQLKRRSVRVQLAGSIEPIESHPHFGTIANRYGAMADEEGRARFPETVRGDG